MEYTWDGRNLVLYGTAGSSGAACNIWLNSDGFPAGIAAGDTLHVKVSGATSNARLNITFFNGANTTGTNYYLQENEIIKVPNDATAVRIRGWVVANKSVDTTITTTITKTMTNKDLAEKFGGKYVAFGDSLMLGAVWNATNDGTASHRVKEEWTIPYRIALAIGAMDKYENSAVSGIGYLTTVEVSSQDKSIVDIITEHDYTGVELVTVMAGANDKLKSGNILGTSEAEADDGTICGAIREIIDFFHDNHPKIQLVIIQCTPSGIAPPNDNWDGVGAAGWSMNMFDAEVSKMCNDNHVAYVNWWDCTYCNTWNSRNIGYSSNIGPNYTHPIADYDYCILGDFIASKIRGITTAKRQAETDSVKKISVSDMIAGKFYRLDLDSFAFDKDNRLKTDDGYSTILLQVSAGEKVRLRTTAGSIGAKPYALIGSNQLIYTIYASSTKFDGTITIQKNGWMVVNLKNTYAEKFICEIHTDTNSVIRKSQLVNALFNSDYTRFPVYEENDRCRVINNGMTFASAIERWAIIGASFDSGEYNYTVPGADWVSEFEDYPKSCWEHFKKINGIIDLYNYSNGGQNARDWIRYGEGEREARTHAYATDTEEVATWGDSGHTKPYRSGIGYGGGNWWKMYEDYQDGDVKQAFVINLGSNDINNNYPHDDNWDTLETYGDEYYTCGTTADIGTYDLETDTDTVPSGKTEGIVPGVVNSYAAYIGAILNRIIAIQPNAIIFLCTIRNGFASNANRMAIWNEYNDMLKEIAQMEQYSGNVIIVDNGEYGPNYAAAPMKNMMVYHHPNAIGYQYLAGYWNTLINDAIQRNYNTTLLKQSQFIGTGKQYTPLT